MIADDHGILRRGVRLYLENDPEIELVGEASNGREAVRLARELRPEVVLMDLLMPVMDGWEAIRLIREGLPDTEVIALTSVLDDSSVGEAIRAGAIGYLLKNADPTELRRAIRAAASGQVHLCPEAATRLVRQVQLPATNSNLTERETAVLRLVAKGAANKEIARKLDIAQQTVKLHVSRILTKLQLQSRTQAALYAVDRGLVNGGPTSGR